MTQVRLRITTHEDNPHYPQLAEESAPGGGYKASYKEEMKAKDVKSGHQGTGNRLIRFDSVLLK